MVRARLLIALLALAVLFGAVGTARSDVAVPTGLHGFLLRADESPKTVFSRTPSFAWNPVSGAERYEFQLSLSDTFRDNAIVFADATLKDPVEAPSISLPWISGNPHSLYARVRAFVNGVASPWSSSFGFDMAPPAPPTPLPSYPGLLRWTPVEGAVKYEIWFVDANNEHVFTTTNVLDEREFYAFHQTQNWIGTVRWRIRAWRADPSANPTINNIPATKWGAWSPVYSSTNPAFSTGAIHLLGTISDVFSNGSDSSPAHRLMPAFLWSGNQTAAGTPAELYRVEVFSDKACLNPVYTSPAVASPAYAPRPFGSIQMPNTSAGIAAARASYLPTGSEPAAVTFAGDPISINEFQPPATPTTTAPGSPGGSTTATASPGSSSPGSSAVPPASGTAVTFPDSVGAPIDLWDTDWPHSGYYWTVIPVGVQAPDQLSTAVTASASSGGNSIQLADSTGFRVGDVITIGVAPSVDTTSILSISGNTVTLGTKLAFSHFQNEPVVRSNGVMQYRDLEMAQDVCAAGRVARFGMDSEPSLTASDDLFATGLSSAGRLTSALHTTQFYGQPLVSWTPALGAWDYEVQWSKTNEPFAPLGTAMTKSTSFVLPITAGTWYYRVRGFDFSLPTGSQQMAWSDPSRILVAKPQFKVISGGMSVKPTTPTKKKKTTPKSTVGTTGLKVIRGAGFTMDIPTTWQLKKVNGIDSYTSSDNATMTTVVFITKDYASTAASYAQFATKQGAKVTTTSVTIPAGRAKLLTAVGKDQNGKAVTDIEYFVQDGTITYLVAFETTPGKYAATLPLFRRMIQTFRLG